MAQKFVSRGFKGRSRENYTPVKERIPPGQYQTKDFPVLSAGPTPRRSLATWDFSIYGEIAEDLKWSWEEFRKLPRETITVDIHCVTKWSKLDTVWTGVSVDTLLDAINLNAAPSVKHLIAFCDGGYTTNVPLADVRGGKAWIVDEYDGRPLDPEHGGPARLLVPHLYFWKSAKWVRGFKLISENRAGFWEAAGYHNYGDPWKEQRYAGD
ncbi:MAG TPA: sulfite oxidase-like oxidoreductase [Pyrinomonadaceae bacterium]|nr:sulfite oxidase-like oxidoreductase [Pyrinomonadaceae bacterium]